MSRDDRNIRVLSEGQQETECLPGVLGARITGGGFGGCTLTLVEETQVTNLREQLRLNYVQITGQGARYIYMCRELVVPGEANGGNSAVQHPK